MTRHLVTIAVVLVASLACAPPVLAQDAAQAQQASPHQAHGAAPTAPATKDTRDQPSALPPFIPPVTDADRQAAFPQVEGHPVHGRSVQTLVLVDRLEWQQGDEAGIHWKAKGWIGGDINRLWFRTEGASEDGDLHHGEAHALYGRAVSRWWDLVAGVRQDVRPGSAQTWAAVGLQGLAPYWFEVEATAYVGAEGRTQFRLETEYELLLSNRLIAQPLVELEFAGKDDPEHGIGAGLSSMETGLRVRYRITSAIAPYAGVTWDRAFFGTADLRRASGREAGHVRLALGARFWF